MGSLLTAAQQRTVAKQFTKDRQGWGDEQQEMQTFWLALLQKIFDEAELEKFGAFKLPVKTDSPQLGREFHRANAWFY